jgi:hypothetical protein
MHTQIKTHARARTHSLSAAVESGQDAVLSLLKRGGGGGSSSGGVRGGGGGGGEEGLQKAEPDVGQCHGAKEGRGGGGGGGGGVGSSRRAGVRSSLSSLHSSQPSGQPSSCAPTSALFHPDVTAAGACACVLTLLTLLTLLTHTKGNETCGERCIRQQRQERQERPAPSSALHKTFFLSYFAYISTCFSFACRRRRSPLPYI